MLFFCCSLPFVQEPVSHLCLRRAQARLFTAVQTIACRHERSLIKTMHDIRDSLRMDPSGREICEGLPSQFGSVASVRCAEILKQTRDTIFGAQLNVPALHDLDRRVCLPLVHITAKLAVDEFKMRLRALFPGAVDDCEALDTDQSAGFAVLIAPLKGEPRIRVKLEEYRSEPCSPEGEWLFTTKARIISDVGLPVWHTLH